MTIPSLQQLNAFPTRDQVRDKLTAYLKAAEVPVTDFEPGAGLRDLMELTAIGLVNVGGSAIPDIIAGGYPEVTTPSAADWITLIADQFFALTRIAATATQQTVKLTCDGTHGPYTISSGVLMVYSPLTGNRYRAITGGTLNTSSTLTITVQAEATNDSLSGRNYVDPANTLTLLLTPLPGVSCNNPPPNFSAVTPTPTPATGLGVVTVSGTAPTNPSTYDVFVSLSGQGPGGATPVAAKIQTRVNGGAWTAPATMGSSFTFSAGPTVTFSDDAGLTNPSFVAGDLYSFTSPGSPITLPGQDQETITALLTRCFARFPPMNATSAQEKRVVWAKAANAAVTRGRPAPSAAHPGRVDLYIAGVTNPLSGGVVTAVQNYIDQHEAIGDRTVVAAATVQSIAATGSVTAPTVLLSQVQAAAAIFWAAYVIATDIGGVVRLAELEQALKDAGATDVGTPAGGALALTGGSPNVQLAVGAVATPGDITTTLTWKGI